MQRERDFFKQHLAIVKPRMKSFLWKLERLEIRLSSAVHFKNALPPTINVIVANSISIGIGIYVKIQGKRRKLHRNLFFVLDGRC